MIIPGRVYRHCKGNFYKVICLARSEEWGDPVVVYNSITKCSENFVRRLDAFTQRFSLVDMPKYAIVNTVDRPCVRLVAELIEDKYYYMNREMDPNLKQYDGMSFYKATSMECFGFEIIEHKSKVHFVLKNKSTAVYANGNSREWQDEVIEFILPKVVL